MGAADFDGPAGAAWESAATHSREGRDERESSDLVHRERAQSRREKKKPRWSWCKHSATTFRCIQSHSWFRERLLRTRALCTQRSKTHESAGFEGPRETNNSGSSKADKNTRITHTCSQSAGHRRRRRRSKIDQAKSECAVPACACGFDARSVGDEKTQRKRWPTRKHSGLTLDI